MNEVKKIHESMNRTRLTLGLPTLVICLLLTTIFMAWKDRVHLDFIVVIVVAWTAGFFVRGIVDALAEGVEEALDIVEGGE